MRSTTDVLQSLISAGKGLSKVFLFAPGTAESDILSACAVEFGRSYCISEYLSGISNLNGFKRIISNTSLHQQMADIFNVTVSTITTLISNELDNYAADYGLTRKPAVKARGPVKLVFPGTTPVSINSGVEFKSINLNTSYKTIEKITSLAPTLVSGEYIIYVMCESSLTGSDYNVVSGTSFSTSSAIANLIRIIVPFDITNGSDKESDLDFIDRLEIYRYSKGIGSKSWLESLIKADTRVYDVKTYSILDKDAGYFDRPWGIDAWVYCESERKIVRNEPVFPPFDHVLKKQPLVLDDPILNTSQFSTISITTKKDTVYKGTVLDISSVKPLTTTTTVDYFTDQTIRDLQEVVYDPDNWLFGGRSLVLIKQASRVLININVDYYLIGGGDKDLTETTIREDVLKFFNGGTTSAGRSCNRKLINEYIDYSDIETIILEVDEVDRIIPSTFKVQRDDQQYKDNTSQVQIDFNEYASLGTVILNNKG